MWCVEQEEEKRMRHSLSGTLLPLDQFPSRFLLLLFRSNKREILSERIQYAKLALRHVFTAENNHAGRGIITKYFQHSYQNWNRVTQAGNSNPTQLLQLGFISVEGSLYPTELSCEINSTQGVLAPPLIRRKATGWLGKGVFIATRAIFVLSLYVPLPNS